ncbi:hypothetical protein, partial [Escherichia coli]|uniref:hypothetical protein n=1 Tax=Escherichia coli TaxID=562 RepID=UPI000A3DDCB8
MKENLSVTLNIPGTLSAQGIHEPLSHQLHSIYTLTDADSSQQDHNNQCQQYGNDTVCIPVIAEGVDRTWICPYISRHLLSLNPLLACC